MTLELTREELEALIGLCELGANELARYQRPPEESVIEKLYALSSGDNDAA
jgi:hypothetical protein